MPKGVYNHYKIRGELSSKKGKTYEEIYGEEKAAGIRNKISETETGRTVSEETKKRMRESHLGKHPLKETKKKIKVSNSGENNPKYGKTYEEYYGEEKAKEIKKKQSKSSEGKKHGSETIKKMSEAKKGKTFKELYGDKSEDMKNNLRGKLTGQHFQTEESRKRIGQASTERWQDEEYRKKCILEISSAFSVERKKEYSEKWSGENNPNWAGGVWHDLYSFEFNEEFKILIRERDNNTCQLCGKTQKESKRKLHVHHINYDKENDCSDMSNFITLCGGCNSRVNFNKEYWISFFKSNLERIATLKEEKYNV